MPPDSLKPPGELVAGKYRLVRLLGRGGMGAVWEGVHETLGTKVAVKFIDAECAASDEARQRFVNEAKAAARLRSKHVVQVYDQGVSSDARPYIVMEWLGGEPLDVRLDRVGRLSPADTATLMGHVCRALTKAHGAGVVHRDLKPENVFIVHDDEDRTDIAKVVDFGIAKFVDASVPGSSSTQTGAVLGTPQFMSPEQARGLRSVDHRTDLWSVGVIAYRCLTGVLPFKGEAMGDLLVNICTQEAPAPSSVAPVPPGFDEWTRRALAREPTARFQSAVELADALSAICGVELRVGSGATVVNPDVAAVVARAYAGDPAIAATTPQLPGQDRDGERRGAITAQPFAANSPPASVGGTAKRPLWIAGVAALVVVSAVVARSFMHQPAPKDGPGVASRPPQRTAEPVAAAAEEPAVTPSPTAAPAETAEPAPAVHVGRKNKHTPKAEKLPVQAKPSAPAAPAPARPSRPKDELGY